MNSANSIEFLNSLREKWRNFIFRRVCRSQIDDPPHKRLIKYHSSSKNIKYMKYDAKIKFTAKEIAYNVAYYAKTFTVYTTSTMLRENDEYDNPLTAHSSCYTELNWEYGGNLQFYNSSIERLYEIPRNGQLICGLVDSDNDCYTKWFLCSEQFYKLWTCVMYGNETYPHHNKYYQLIKRMKCNSYEESLLRNKKENTDEFYIIRTEEVSKRYFYIYQAIATWLFEPDKLIERSKEWGNSFPGGASTIRYLKSLN